MMKVHILLRLSSDAYFGTEIRI